MNIKTKVLRGRTIRFNRAISVALSLVINRITQLPNKRVAVRDLRDPRGGTQAGGGRGPKESYVIASCDRTTGDPKCDDAKILNSAMR